MEAARSERVSAGRRGDRDGNAAHSARTRGRCACAGSVRALAAGCARRAGPQTRPRRVVPLVSGKAALSH
jgi:hypothetical protein